MRRRSWLLVVIGVAALFIGCGRAGLEGAASPAPGAANGWVEVVTPHFVIDTDLEPGRALAMARALEETRAALLASAWAGSEPPRGKTRVMLFSRQRDLSRYAGRNSQGFVFTRPGFERLLAFRDGGDVPTVAVHELVHDLSRWFLPLQPLWLAEGLAVYLEGIEIDAARGQVVLGRVSRDSAEWLKEARFIPSTSSLFATRDADTLDRRDTASFYLGSWAFVHYLLDEHPRAFERFQEALGRLTPWRVAWEQSFPGLTSAELDRAFAAYLTEGRFSTATRRFAAPVFTPGVRALSPAEVHGARALLASTGKQSIAGAEVSAALALDPDELNALTVRFYSLAPSERGPRALIARRAVAAHPESARAWLLAALAATTFEERRRALAQAQRLDPEHPGVTGLLAEEALRRDEPHAALDYVRLTQRRSGVTHRNVALQFAALAASNPCGDAAALPERAELRFEPECRVAPRAGEPTLGCADYVRRALAAPSSCPSEAL